MKSAWLVGLALVGCVMPQTPQQSAPVALHVTHSVSEVAQIAAQQLTLTGFALTPSDATGGIVSAHRDKVKTGNSDYVTCKYPNGSSGSNLMATDMRVSVIAKPANGGADVQITGAVRTTYPGMAGSELALAMPPNDEDCASNGVMEKRIADALR